VCVVFQRAIAAEFHDVRLEVSISKARGHIRDSTVNVVAGRLIRGTLCVHDQGVPLMCTSATRIGWTAKSQFEKVGEDLNTAEEWIYWEEAEGVAGGKKVLD
jgi:hypothetical protein